MKRTPNKQVTLIHDNGGDFWIDDYGCLQPCPMCHEEDVRDVYHVTGHDHNSRMLIAHNRCWARMEDTLRHYFIELRQGMVDEIERQRDRYDDVEDDEE